eukprot:6219367-Alexandrium_andersonii.AAC.1
MLFDVAGLNVGRVRYGEECARLRWCVLAIIDHGIVNAGLQHSEHLTHRGINSRSIRLARALHGEEFAELSATLQWEIYRHGLGPLCRESDLALVLSDRAEAARSNMHR